MGMAMDAAELRRRAISRALANGGAAAVQRVRFGLYKVASSTRPGTQHTVSVDAQGHYWCSCPAAVAGRPTCWHRASVYIAKVEHGGGRVTGPAACPMAIPAPTPDNVIAFPAQRAA